MEQYYTELYGMLDALFPKAATITVSVDIEATRKGKKRTVHA